MAPLRKRVFTWVELNFVFCSWLGDPAARAGTPAPQFGTGVLAGQIAKKGLEIGRYWLGGLQCLAAAGAE
jgi:hypothetical protein